MRIEDFFCRLSLECFNLLLGRRIQWNRKVENSRRWGLVMEQASERGRVVLESQCGSSLRQELGSFCHKRRKQR